LAGLEETDRIFRGKPFAIKGRPVIAWFNTAAVRKQDFLPLALKSDVNPAQPSGLRVIGFVPWLKSCDQLGVGRAANAESISHENCHSLTRCCFNAIESEDCPWLRSAQQLDRNRQFAGARFCSLGRFLPRFWRR